MRKTSLLVVALLIGGLAGCDSEDVTGNSDLLPLETDTFAVVDGEDAFSNVETATLDSEMAMNPVFSGGGHFARHRRHPHGPGSHLAPVLMRLDLDETQRLQIRELVGQHRSSIRAAMEGLREVNMELIRQANEERRAIKEAFHAGEITREEAVSLLEDYRDRLGHYTYLD
jgi:hypothetical protein